MMTAPDDNKIGFLRNLGNGTFGFYNLVDITAGWMEFVGNADFNADGLVDIAYLDESTNIVTIKRATTIGTYFPSTTLAPFESPMRDHEIADGDGDGRMDIVIALDETNTFRWYRNITTGVTIAFEAAVTFDVLAIGGVSGMTMGDWNNDGLIDLVHGSNEPYSLAVWSNSGAGEMVDGFVLDDSDFHVAKELHVDQLDSGPKELIVSASVDNIGVFRSIANGNFWQSNIGEFKTSYPTMATGDIDSDGDVDIVARKDGGLVLLTNNGFSIFSESVINSSAIDNPTKMILVDVDGDDDIDLVVSSEPTILNYEVHYFINHGSGYSGVAVQIADGAEIVMGLISGDVDGNGTVDLIISLCNFGGDHLLLVNDGFGAITAPVALNTDISICGRSSLVDMDGDGDLDLLGPGPLDELTFNTYGVVWTENNGSGEFGIGPNSNHSFFEELDVKTILADGIPDLVIAQFDDIRYSEGTITGYLDAQVITTKVNGMRDLATTDLNGDGRPDLVSLSNRDDRLAWYANLSVGCPADINGDGMVNVLDFIQYNSAFGNTCASCPEDINNDGVVDVLDFIQYNSAFGSACD